MSQPPTVNTIRLNIKVCQQCEIVKYVGIRLSIKNYKIILIYFSFLNTHLKHTMKCVFILVLLFMESRSPSLSYTAHSP